MNLLKLLPEKDRGSALWQDYLRAIEELLEGREFSQRANRLLLRDDLSRPTFDPAQAQASFVDGALLAFSMTQNGSGYQLGNPPSVTIDPPAAGGVAATVTVVLVPDLLHPGYGSVGAIVVTNFAYGYSSSAPPTVTIDPPSSGVQAEATPLILDGVVSEIRVVTGGEGYVDPPAVNIAPPPVSSPFADQAAAYATVVGGKVTAITVSRRGSGYTLNAPPKIDIAPAEIKGQLVTDRLVGLRPTDPNYVKNYLAALETFGIRSVKLAPPTGPDDPAGFDFVAKVAGLHQLLDGRLAPDAFLPSLAGLLGWELESNLTAEEQRQQVLLAIDWYKKKGTYSGFNAVFAMLGVPGVVTDLYSDNYDWTDWTNHVKEGPMRSATTDWYYSNNNQVDFDGLDPADGWFKTPHFLIQAQLTRIWKFVREGNTVRALWDGTRYDSLVRLVDKMRPVHTVPHFRLLLTVDADVVGTQVGPDYVAPLRNPPETWAVGKVACEMEQLFLDQTGEAAWALDGSGEAGKLLDQSPGTCYAALTKFRVGTGTVDVDDESRPPSLSDFGVVKKIVVVNGGSGYESVPAVTITDTAEQNGTGATAEAVVEDGIVTAILVTNGGSGYHPAKLSGEDGTIVEIAAPTGEKGEQATATACVSILDETGDEFTVESEQMFEDRVEYVCSIKTALARLRSLWLYNRATDVIGDNGVIVTFPEISVTATVPLKVLVILHRQRILEA